MVHLPEKMSDMIEEATKSSSYLSSNKMIYIEVDLNWDDCMCNQFNQYGDDCKEFALNITDTISSESQLFQNGTSSINVTELKSCIHQNNILDQELNSQVYRNSNFDNEIPPSPISHEKYVPDMKNISRNKTKLLQNNIKAPNVDFFVTDNSKEECYQPETASLTDENDEKSVALDISNENVIGIKENLSDKYITTETNVEIISNKPSEKQEVSGIPILSSYINNDSFLSKEMIDIPCSEDSFDTFSQDSSEDYSPLSSLSVNSTEFDTSDLIEKFGNVLNISDRRKSVEDEPWKHLDLNEITLDDNENDEDEDDYVTENNFSDKISLSQSLWNSRGLKHLQAPEIPKDNRSSLTPCKRPFDDSYRWNDSSSFENSGYTTFLCHDPSQITSEKGKKTPPKKEKIAESQNCSLSNNPENCNISSYVTENIEELKTACEILGINFSDDDDTDSLIDHSEVCSALDSESNDYPEYSISKFSVKVSTESCNGNTTVEMQQPTNFDQKQTFVLPSSNSIIAPIFAFQTTLYSFTASPKKKINQQQIDRLTKEDFNKIGESGTLLHEMAIHNEYDLLEALLKRLDKLQFKQHIINFKNNYQQTALHLAVTKNFPSTVHILIKHGADVNLLAESCQGNGSKFEAPLHLAASRLNKLLVKELLKAKDIDLDLKNSDGQTALHCAIHAPHSAGTDKTYIISKLITMKANPSCKDKEQGKNILMYAIEFDDYSAISAILKTASWEYIKKMTTDESNKGKTCLTLVNALDKDHELFSKRCKLVQTLKGYQEKIDRELQDVQPHP